PEPAAGRGTPRRGGPAAHTIRRRPLPGRHRRAVQSRIIDLRPPASGRRPLHAKDLAMTATAAPETVTSRSAALAGSLPEAAVLAVLRAALQEDAPYGDITSQT